MPLIHEHLTNLRPTSKTPKFKVGDKIRVKTNAKEIMEKMKFTLFNNQESLFGKICEIKEVDTGDKYLPYTVYSPDKKNGMVSQKQPSNQ